VVETLLWFKQNDADHIMVLKLSGKGEPLSRKFFQGQYGGAVLLTKNKIIRSSEVDHTKIDRWIDDCGKLEIEGVNEESIEFLKEK
jgi:hypothetical protein